MRKSRMALWIVIGAFCSGAIATIPTLASGALASGAAPPPPAVSSVAATHVTGSGARLNGAINPNGQQTSYAFQWGPTTGYGHETPLTSGGAGSAPESVSANLAGLDGGSTYHFRVIAINASGTSVGADESFTTSGTRPSPSAAPSATTTEATGVNQAGATLNGTDNPNGQATTYYFEYGPTTNYGYETGPVAAGSGKTAQAATATLGGLPSGATVYYRLVAVNAGGTSLGAGAAFTTATPPAVATGLPSQITDKSVRVNGMLDPHGQSTTFFFQYGTTTAYGLQTAPVAAGSGTGNVAVHALLTGLTTSATYHYRLVAESAGGISYGADQMATVGPAPSQVAYMGRMGFVSPGGVMGVEAGCFGGDTSCVGHVKLRAVRTGAVIGQRNFDIPAHTGGFENLRITKAGRRLLKHNSKWHLLRVNVTITTPNDRKTSERMTIARWVWHH